MARITVSAGIILLLALLCAESFAFQLQTKIFPNHRQQWQRQTRTSVSMLGSRPPRDAHPTASDLSLFGDDYGSVLKSSNTATCASEPLKRCYFDKYNACTGCGTCPFDDRPCSANRDYFDHIYGSDCRIIEPSSMEDDEFTSNNRNSSKDTNKTSAEGSAEEEEEDDKEENNNFMQMLVDAASASSLRYSRRHQQYVRSLSARERRLRRQKLFKLANVLDDLLPDPAQGKSWMVNMLLDAAKISIRAAIVALSSARIVSKPPILQFK